jgi:hypothetical protein
MSQAGSDTEDETEFVTEDVPVLTRSANLKGRKQSLALAREKKCRNQKVVKNVMEVHKEINMAKQLTARLSTSIGKAKLKAAEEGITLPAMDDPAPPVQAADPALLEMMKMMAYEIKSLKASPPPPLPPPIPEPPKVEKPKRVRAPPKKKEPVPEPDPPAPVNLVQQPPSAHQQRQAEKEGRMEALRRALGRK